MGRHRIKLRDRRKILSSFGVCEKVGRGKGSHTVFFKDFEGSEFTYPVPTTRDDVLPVYVKGIRKRFRLLPSDGVTDDDFFGRS